MNDNLSSITETTVDENVNIHSNKRSESKDAVAASKGLSPIASSAKDVSEVDSEKEISPHRINIKDRFTFAKKQQEKREKERLNKIKHNPRHSMQPSDLAALDASSENSMYQSPTQKDFTNKFRQGLATPNMLWSDAIRKLQEKQEHRHKQVRTASQDASKQVDAFQVASKRINQWEEIVFYEPTALELANTWQKVRGYLQMPVEDQTAYIQNVEECQAMIIGSVKVMSCADFSTETMSYLQSQLTPRTKYMGLKTSIHAIGTNATITIPLKMIAIVCRVHPRDHDLALFVVAHVQPGYSEDDVATIFYTPLQLKLFAPSSSTSTTTNGVAKGILAQKTVQIMSSESQAAFQDVLIEDFPISDFYEDEYAQPGQVSSSTMDEIQRAIQANGGELCSPEVRAMTRKLSMGVRADYQEYATPVHDTKRSASSSGGSDEDEAVRAFNSNFSSPFHAVEGELPTSVSPMIEYSASTPKKAWGTPVPPAKDDSATTMSLSGDASVMTSSLAAASTLSVPSQAFINLDLQLVESVACTEKTLLLQKHTAAAGASSTGAADESERSVVMINHALKTTVCENAQCVALDNRLFELNRGVAISGSIAKLPTSAQGWGQAKRRFFVLKDTSLAYFSQKPAGDVFAPELRPKRLYPITEHTQIDVIHIAGVRRCVKISFPETQQTLYWYFHAKTPSNQAKEAKWIHGIRQAIALQRSKQEAMLTTMSLKTWWFHEGNDFQLIAYDVARVVSSLEDEWAMNGPGEYVRVALFRTQTSYFCDMILPSQEKLQVALVRTNEQPVLCCSTATKTGNQNDGTAGTVVTLRTVKIYGDKLLLGGDGNVLFVGMLGRTTGVHLTEAGRKVLYCVPVAWPSPASTTTGRRPSVSKSTTAAAAAVATRSAASAAVRRSSRRSQFDSDASDADDTDDDDDDDGNGQWDVDMSFEEDPADAAAARSRGTTAYGRQPRRLRPRGGGSRSRTTSQASPSTSNAPPPQLPSLPSMSTSYRWDSFATDDRMHVFVAIDRRQNVLATFQCDLPTATTPPTSRLLESPSKKRPGFYYQVKPELQSMFSLAQLATTATGDERILYAQFLADYPAGHLLISTTHRLLLLCITAQEKSMWNSTTLLGGGGAASTTSPMSASSVVTATQPMVFAVSSYVVLDTVDVAAGQRGAFAVQSVSAPLSSSASSSMRRVSSSRVSLSSAASSHSETVIGGASSSSPPPAQQKLVLWRVVQEAAAVAADTTAAESIRLAHVTRREISREQVQELLCRAHGV